MASAGVLVGFCGNGATPLLAGVEAAWLSPQNEYRPTAYVQAWLSFWFDGAKRLLAAKEFQRQRCQFLEKVWNKDRELNDCGFYADDEAVRRALSLFRKGIENAKDITALLISEARFTKQLYAYAAEVTEEADFSRNHDGEDKANIFLNHGNYLAYGLGACTLWTLGIPYAFAVMHGKTRRGALVFDVADLIKDAIVLPVAFLSAQDDLQEKAFRVRCLEKFTEHKALDFMFDVVKQCSTTFASGGGSI